MAATSLLDRKRDYQRARRAAAKAADLCTACCVRPREVGKSCAICAERRRASYAKTATAAKLRRIERQDGAA